MSFLVAFALLWMGTRRKQRQCGKMTTAAAGHPQSLEEAAQYTGKPELDAQDTMRDAAIAETEETSAPPVSGPPPMPLHSRPNIPDLSATFSRLTYICNCVLERFDKYHGFFIENWFSVYENPKKISII